jgi:hypothetical protein
LSNYQTRASAGRPERLKSGVGVPRDSAGEPGRPFFP